jgi:hypothetical protein
VTGQERDDDDDAGRPPGIDTSVAHQARIYDYWLGGKDNFAVDREAGDRAVAAYPGMAKAVRANRAFLARAVRYLAAEAGVRQFLDIGTGIPAGNNTHEVAQSVAPESRIVYVDNDPVVLLHARALLTSAPEGACAYLDADLRDTGKILAEAADPLDFGAPVALMLLGILQVIPDSDDPFGVVAELLRALAPGSYLVISHVASDLDNRAVQAAALLDAMSVESRTLRSHAEVARFFDGTELVAPGIVPVAHWRPESDLQAAAPRSRWGGVGRKA